MKTIAVFHPSNELYGADRILVNALAAFPAANKKIVYLPKDGPLTSLLKSEVENISVTIVPSLPIIYRAIFTPRGILDFLQKKRAFRNFFRVEHAKHQFDLAYVNTLSCSFILPLLKKMNLRSICHVHEIIERPKIIAKVTAILAHRSAAQIICVSEAVRKNMLLHAPSAVHKTIVLHNGIAPIDVQAKDGQEFRFYLFGRIMPKKGQWYLLDALREISPKLLSNTRFVLVGGTLQGQEHLLDELRQKITEWHLNDVIELAGFRPQIVEEMTKADVCLVPSLMKDPFPTTVLEAMSAGKPVIATNHGGAQEVIENGVNGYLIAPDKPTEFARAIEMFLSNRTHAAQLGKAAKQTFNDAFTIEHFNNKWLQTISV